MSAATSPAFCLNRRTEFQDVHSIERCVMVSLEFADWDLSSPEREKDRCLPTHSARSNWRALSDRDRRRTMGAAYYAEGGRGGWWRRLAWDQPRQRSSVCPTIQHWAYPSRRSACLSVKECAALRRFRRGSVSRHPRSQYQQIGNASAATDGRTHRALAFDHFRGQVPIRPDPPQWRQASANRRIGTHGWTEVRRGSIAWKLIAKLREDHVWSGDQQELRFG